MEAIRKVVVVGGGGREHALAWKLAKCAGVTEVVVCPGNAGIRGASADATLYPQPADLTDLSGLVELCRAESPDLVVVGPEAPLCDGLIDRLSEVGILAYGPSQRAAELEGSKVFMKEFALRHGIRTAEHRILIEVDQVDEAVDSFDRPPVVKADGLCAGKGVYLPATHAEARTLAGCLLRGERHGRAGKTIILERRLGGFELSVQAICDGERALILPVAQDHKRIFDGDRGPNTGGMGAYAPALELKDALLERVRTEIIMPIVRGMASEGRPFRGTLFAGLMVEESEPNLLEINVRFGDPETQVIMPLLSDNLAWVLAGAAKGRLPDVPLVPEERKSCTVGVVMAAKGYPEGAEKGAEISGLSALVPMTDTFVFHAGTGEVDGKLLVAGGRVLCVVSKSSSFAEAKRRAYRAVQEIDFDGAQYRRDIGAAAPASF